MFWSEPARCNTCSCHHVTATRVAATTSFRFSSCKNALAAAPVAAAAPAVPDGYAVAAGVERLALRALAKPKISHDLRSLIEVPDVEGGHRCGDGEEKS